MAASLMGIGLLLTGTAAPAQDPARPAAWPYSAGATAAPQPARVLHFVKQPNAPPALGRGRETTPQRGAPLTLSAPRMPAIRPIAFQQPKDAAFRVADEGKEYEVQLEPPGPLRLFRLESERALQERVRQEKRDQTAPGSTPDRTEFPEEPVITRQPYAGRAFPPRNLSVEPQYVCYGRLLFEEKNSERYGWDLGPVQPLVSATAFFWDVAALPYHLWTSPCRQYECSAGHCLPGDPVPYLLYPPELSLTGTVAEAGTIAALLAIFP